MVELATCSGFGRLSSRCDQGFSISTKNFPKRLEVSVNVRDGPGDDCETEQSRAWLLKHACRVNSWNSTGGFCKLSNLTTPNRCVKLQSHNPIFGGYESQGESTLKCLVCRCVHQITLDDSKSNKHLGRRGFMNLALGLIGALIGGRWGENESALAVAKKLDALNSPYDEKRLLEQNKRMQKLNNAPPDFPGFIREGFDVKVITDDRYVKAESGLIYLDLIEGEGKTPSDGQQVVFHYTGYNENGRRVDSSYQQGQPARTRLGIKGMIPGFEEGIRTMRLGGTRRIVIPPELGPPVGPSTFFSAKQFEVFDVELLDVKDCTRRTIAFYSDVVCD
ncbi:unnamed protein product [Sphagnum jensenii]|uniref:peptidylprolyl isomerase n=1 Tax=Sphagnum jensenii TaxID=128206 RepID=A0ABP0WS50_9BRYO